jgi:hypothetical protein
VNPTTTPSIGTTQIDQLQSPNAQTIFSQKKERPITTIILKKIKYNKIKTFLFIADTTIMRNHPEEPKK